MNEKLWEKIKQAQTIAELDFSNLQSWESVEKSFELGQPVDINGSINTCLLKKKIISNSKPLFLQE